MTAMSSATDSSRQAVKPPVSPREKPWQTLPAGKVRRASPPVPDAPMVSGYEYRCAAAGRQYICSGDNTCVAVAFGDSGHPDGVLSEDAVLSSRCVCPLAISLTGTGAVVTSRLQHP